MKLYKDNVTIFESLNLVHPLIKYGSNENKIKVALTIKDKIDEFAND
jgi:hypothetical protein